MIFWDILIYFCIAVCYFGAVAVIYGWIKHGIDQKKKKSSSVEE